MSQTALSLEEQKILLELAREALITAVNGRSLPPIDLSELPERLQAPGASFVTLTKHGDLRGCIGILEADTPLAQDVREHAVAAALDDYRFPPVRPEELDSLNIEISYLTTPHPLEYQDAEDLLSKLRPHIDGVVLRDGPRRATFLPQVWEKISRPEIFLDQLCLKMGAPKNLWRTRKIRVEVYQVQEFHE